MAFPSVLARPEAGRFCLLVAAAALMAEGRLLSYRAATMGLAPLDTRLFDDCCEDACGHPTLVGKSPSLAIIMRMRES
jgi:hypothetical protein